MQQYYGIIYFTIVIQRMLKNLKVTMKYEFKMGDCT